MSNNNIVSNDRKSRQEIINKKKALIDLYHNGHLSPQSKGRLRVAVETLEWVLAPEGSDFNFSYTTITGYDRPRQSKEEKRD